MQYTFHRIESRIIDFLLFPKGLDFIARNKNRVDYSKENEYSPEHLTEEFESIEESLKPFDELIRKFYFDSYTLPQLLMEKYSPFGYSSSEKYLEMLEQEDEESILISILTRLYLDAKESDTVDDSVIRTIVQDINQQMDLVGALDMNDEEKWKLVGLIRNSKALTLEWIRLMRELQPLFTSYYDKKKIQVEALGSRLEKELNESNGEAFSTLTKGLINKSLIPSGSLIVSCIEPISLQLYETTSVLFIHWGLQMEAFFQFVEEAQESELKERVAVFKNLGDKTRYEIVKLISQGVESAKIIANTLEVSQPTISYHINYLLISKIIYLERSDTKYKYKVDFEHLQKCYLAMLKDFGK